MTELTLPLPPSVNRLWRGNRSGRRWLDPKAAAFKETAAKIALANGVRPTGGKFEVDVVFFVNPRHPRDLDNSIKVLLDALNGIAWVDDSQVRRLAVEMQDARVDEQATVMRFGPLDEGETYRRHTERLLRRA